MQKNKQIGPVYIRRMDMSDVPFVLHYETKMFDQHVEEKALYEEIIENKVSHYYMALLENERIGYIGVWIPRPNAEILTLYIKEDFRKKDYGFVLLDFLLNQLAEENVDSVTLEVRISNVAAISLYKKAGFKQVSVRKNYYKDGEDALLMYKLIGGQE